MDGILTPRIRSGVGSSPIAVADSLTGGAPIVVLSPHPDDESLGCGALLAHAFAHLGAHVICMTDGSGSHPGSRLWPPQRLAAERRRELSRAIGCLGGSDADITWLGHSDGWLGAQDQDAIVETVAAVCRRTGARHLFAPSAEDHHEDHKSTACIAARVTADIAGLTHLAYPLWSRWDDPDFAARSACRDPVTLDTGPWYAAKRAAIAAHASQLGQVIPDDPDGFVMPRAFVEAFAEFPEIYWKEPA